MLKYVYLLVGAVILVLHLAETSQVHWVPFTEIEQHVWWSMAQGWLLTYCLASPGLPERFCCYEVPLYCCIWNTPISGNFVPCITMHLPLFWVLVPPGSLLWPITWWQYQCWGVLGPCNPRCLCWIAESSRRVSQLCTRPFLILFDFIRCYGCFWFLVSQPICQFWHQPRGLKLWVILVAVQILMSCGSEQQQNVVGLW